jgi:Raf kinase inhibitor-like YbhB/YbcL family protein
MTISLRSPAFADGEMIPRAYTCDGADTSPPLEWSGVPEPARSLALICEDPDAPMGTFSHWVVDGLPAGVNGLKAAVPVQDVVPADSLLGAAEPTKVAGFQGKNDFGKVGYGGPCPPGGTHRYIFRIYALDVSVGPKAAAPTRSDVLQSIKGHILAEGRLVGRYTRSN